MQSTKKPETRTNQQSIHPASDDKIRNIQVNDRFSLGSIFNWTRKTKKQRFVWIHPH